MVRSGRQRYASCRARLSISRTRARSSALSPRVRDAIEARVRYCLAGGSRRTAQPSGRETEKSGDSTQCIMHVSPATAQPQMDCLVCLSVKEGADRERVHPCLVRANSMALLAGQLLPRHSSAKHTLPRKTFAPRSGPASGHSEKLAKHWSTDRAARMWAPSSRAGMPQARRYSKHGAAALRPW